MYDVGDTHFLRTRRGECAAPVSRSVDTQLLRPDTDDALERSHIRVKIALARE